MKITTQFIYILALFILSAVPALAQSNNALRKEMESFYADFNKAIVAEDINSLESFYDPKFTLQVEDEVIDRDEVLSIWRGQFSEWNYEFSKTTVLSVSTTVTGFVIAEVKWEYKAYKSDKNGKKVILEVVNKSTDAWTKSSGGKRKLYSREDGGTEGKIDGKPVG